MNPFRFLKREAKARTSLRQKFTVVGASLLFAAASTGALVLAGGVIWREHLREHSAFVEQSIGDTTALLATQVRLEMEHLEQVVGQVGADRLRPQVASQNPAAEKEVVISTDGNTAPVKAALAEAAGAIASSNASGTVETEPEISEVSLWRRDDPHLPPAQVYLAINSRFASPFAEQMTQIRELENTDRMHLDAAFHGHAVIRFEAFAALSQSLVWIAVPLGHGEVTEVVAAHVHLGRIQKLFSMEGFSQPELLDAEGVVLAHASAQRIGQKEGMPIPALMTQAALGEREPQTFSDAQGKVFYGGSRKVPSYGLSVASSVSVEQADASLEAIRSQMAVYLLFSFGLIFIARWGWITRSYAVIAASASKQALQSSARSSHSSADPSSPLSEPPLAQASDPAENGGDGADESEEAEPAMAAKAPHSAPTEMGDIETTLPLAPRRLAIVALHGSLRGFNQMLEVGGAEEATEALNDYFLMAASVVHESRGHFECYTGASFGAAWELKEGASEASVHAAIQSVLTLRSEMARLNESRKLDGKKPLKQGAGLHVGQALWARLGAVPNLKESVTGEALACARALDRLALAEAKDFVISQAVLKSSRGTFSGKSLGEAKLTADTGLTPYFSVVGYREDLSLSEGAIEAGTFAGDDPSALRPDERLTGGETRAHIARPETVPDRWLVNNGSQIVGPFTMPQLAKMLFTQELDFECECWHEETGRSSRIENAGIFNGVSGTHGEQGVLASSGAGAEDAEAVHWVYDGEVLHGPLTVGFIKTALMHAAFGENAMVCERTTISGWKKISEFVATAHKPGTGSEPRAA